jgi:hypothetical protein
MPYLLLQALCSALFRTHCPATMLQAQNYVYRVLLLSNSEESQQRSSVVHVRAEEQQRDQSITILRAQQRNTHKER